MSLFNENRDIDFSRRQRMVEEQIRQRGVVDERVRQVMLKVQRHLFVPEELRRGAYEDRPLWIGYDQTISQPYMVAFMTAILALLPMDRVLEIGTGCGYQTAVLAELSGEVYSVEKVAPLAEGAIRRLADLGYKNIRIKCGDGYEGWEEHAPYDAVIVTAAPPEIPSRLVEQLKTGGRMVVPVGESHQELYLITKGPGEIKKQNLFPVKFVPMIKGSS